MLLHGLTATRRYVVMGSRTLERAGHRVVSYDARGHGRSTPAPDRGYGYEHLADDLARRARRAPACERAVIAGASMGAHTAVRFALDAPERVAALGLITPSYEPVIAARRRGDRPLGRAGAGAAEGGVEGFVQAYDLDAVPERLARDRRDRAAPAACRPRASRRCRRCAGSRAALAAVRGASASSAQIEVPSVVVASRDEADPGHPLAVGEHYAEAIPGAELVVEEPGPPRARRSPGREVSSRRCWRRARRRRGIRDSVRTYASTRVGRHEL